MECDREDCSFISIVSFYQNRNAQLTSGRGTSARTSSSHHFINLLFRSDIDIRQTLDVNSSSFVLVDGKIIMVSYRSAL